MSRLSLSLGLCAALLCSAASADDLFAPPTPSAYFGFSFGGASAKNSDLHLGFALRQTGVNASAPALAQMDFDSAKGLLAKLGGYELSADSLQLNQTEETAPVAAAPAESKGIISQLGDLAAGVGYGTAAIIGVALIGGAIVVASAGGGGSGDDGGTTASRSSNCPITNGGDPVGPCPQIPGGGIRTVGSDGDCTGVSTSDGSCIGVPAGLFSDRLQANLRNSDDAARDFLRQQWLDSGTGQMGDLLAQN